MRFEFEYRTSDNVLHADRISAPNRDAAFSALKKKGIRPSRLIESPGFFNKLFGKGKRWMVIAVLGVATVVLLMTTARLERQVEEGVQSRSFLPRHQIAGLPADWASHVNAVFDEDIDRMLAFRSQPGLIVGADVVQSGGSVSGAWVDQLRRVVAGMKDDANGFLNLGKSLGDLEVFLDERQKMEAAYRAQLINQARTGALKVEEANRLLASMELPLIGDLPHDSAAGRTGENF